ncbi:MAG: hypothetical protein JXR90_13900 [Spirochaetes bacterium]|nr:hypothetical protein [Spirochaetota bacterium]
MVEGVVGKRLIMRNKYFTLEQCYSCKIQGYMILTPIYKCSSIDELPKEYLDRLGEELSNAIKMVKEKVNPVKVYCLQFGEGSEQLHFHIFPRTQELTDKYLEVYPEQKDLIHGPMLLEWARNEYKEEKINEN